ncbi:Secreted protein [Pseudomonas sp. IT-P44]
MPAKASSQTPHISLTHRQKKPRSSRDRIGAEVGTVEEPLREGDQTFVKPAESSVPTPILHELAENDLFIGIAAIATNRPCRCQRPLRESNHDTVP